MKINSRHLLLFIRLSRPHFLLGGLLLFALGTSIASYLGIDIDLRRYLLGQALVTSIQLMTHYLNEYYDGEGDRENSERTPFSGGSGAIGEGKLPRPVALYSGIAALTLAATFAGLLLLRQAPVLAWLVLILIFVGAYSYSGPPLKLVHSGFGELVASFVVGSLVPAFAFSLQAGQLHRLVVMTTLPLVALHFAMMIAFELPDYATDLKLEKRTLMVRIGWNSAMRIHDLSILFAGLVFLAAFLNGLPWRVSMGTLIVVPLGLAQVWQMGRIREGQPPRWTMLTLTGLLLFALTAYLEWMGYIFS